MKTLALNFTKKGFDYKQLVREGKFAIYEQFKSGTTARTSYEVIEIGSHNGYTIAGVTIAPAETYAGSESWGVKGFTYLTEADAQKKFKKLIKIK